MSTPQLRSEVQRFIKNADNRFLKMVHALALTYSEKEIVAYTTTGIPLSKKLYAKEIEEAEEEISNGKVLSTSELKKRVKNWAKN